ncbi:putative Phosphatidylcholine-sterol acyltransferase [Blattamonas nauphoetae]|uniref:Phosphatidylcholine-sterol acyltransferase n=1 Tax=Blattamonas nauphoetae TaxID=2049346 RepID=A0ABQ9YC85_9EUKA|nr:putative Phosphatidylcholine-sterol acyltransferase [Blattamonas nauphoetae]
MIHFLSIFCLLSSMKTPDHLLKPVDDAAEDDSVLHYTARANRDPVFLVPGLAASGLEYRKKTDSTYKVLWFSISHILPGNWARFVEMMNPIYDPKTDTYSNSPDYDIRPIDYGGMGGVVYLDKTLEWFTKTYENMVNALKEVGYEVKKDLFGVPWDFRTNTINTLEINGEYERFKQLIETSYAINRKPAVLIGHSCGCPFVQHFLLEYVKPEWVQKHIKTFCTFNGPFGGAIMAYHHLSCHAAWIIPVGASVFNKITQKLASIYWMLPNSQAYSPDQVIAEMKNSGEKITFATMNKTWTDTGRDWMAIAASKATSRMEKHNGHPGVDTHIFFSHGKKTASKIIFDDSKPKWWEAEAASVENGDGDGTVPYESLVVPRKWSVPSGKKLEFHEFNDLSHLSIIKDKKVIQELVNIVSRD